jgi:site-specific DNA recombinase
MIAAVYARKSTDQSVADEQKSVVRQIAHAREYAARRGWAVRDDFIFVDDGISGAEFLKRPGFLRLMNTLKPRPPFQILVMSEESRLGREQIEVSYALKQLIQSGVRVFCYLEDRERTLDSPIEKAMLALQTMADEMEREKARQRMVDTMSRKAKAGHVTGGRCFGYENVTVTGPDGSRSHVVQRINESEADVVRKIFELTADGMSRVAIAKQLNAEGLRAPRSQQGRPQAWIQSSVHAVVTRPRYRGEIVWNRTKKRNRWGEKNPTDRPDGEWIRVPATHLQIVSQELWDAAHAQSAAHRGPISPGRRLRESKYLLPGLARCAWCNGGVHVRSRPHDRKQVHFYACTSHFNRGESVCRNLVQVPMGEVDRSVLNAIGDILTPNLVDEVIARVRQLVEPNGRDDIRERIAGDLAAADTQVANLAEAIAMGGDVPALVARLKIADARRLELARQRDALGDGPMVHRIDWAVLERQARRLMADWRGLLARNVPDGRQLLRELLEGPILFTPILEDSRRGVRFEGALSIGGILAGNVEVTRLASPVGTGWLLPRTIPFADLVMLTHLPA